MVRPFKYDSAVVNGVTMANVERRLAEAYTCFSPCSTKLTDEGFEYTVRGELSDVYESTPHSGGYYHVNETYWANGLPDVVSGLSGMPTITYGPDGEGRVSTVSANSGQNPVTGTTYNSASSVTQVTFGSGDSDAFQFDPNTFKETQYRFNVNGQSVTGALTWNPNGSLGKLAITDAFNSADTQTCNYSHDDLARIASANCGSIWSQTFSYDAFGNLTKAGSESFNPGYNAATNRMSNGTYDSNGNVLTDNLHSYAWDSAGRPTTIDSIGMTYDALGRMVEQNRSGTYTQIAWVPTGQEYAFLNGQTFSKAYVPLPASDVAIYTSSGLYGYHHMDWLGSYRLETTTGRSEVFDTAYGPFGEPYATSGSAVPGFTGMTQDTTSNLYDFPAREYGIQGRWPSPDPGGLSAAHLRNPQTLNRYAYVAGRPLESTDPTGMDGGGIVCFLDECCDPDMVVCWSDPSNGGSSGGFSGDPNIGSGFGNGTAIGSGTGSACSSSDSDPSCGQTGCNQSADSTCGTDNNCSDTDTCGEPDQPGCTDTNGNPIPCPTDPSNCVQTDPSCVGILALDPNSVGDLPLDPNRLAFDNSGLAMLQPNTPLTQEQCNLLNEGLNQMTDIADFWLFVQGSAFPLTSFVEGYGLSKANEYINNKLCGGPPVHFP